MNGIVTRVDMFVQIEKINQYVPKFEHDLYVFHVDENSPFNTTIAYLTAFDNDTLDNFGRILYELKNGQNRYKNDIKI